MKQTNSIFGVNSNQSVIVFNSNSEPVSTKGLKGKSRAFRSRVSKQHRCDRIVNRIGRNVACYGATVEVDHANNVCIHGNVEQVNLHTLSRYLKFERIKMVDLLFWGNGDFMIILK